ncbi:YALIA101S03e16864g1_1 [Yarrowia lipolytica]|nr:Hypothetical protein YALI2_E01220g [Yarrowia lipolytica]SEI33378.1 YALIA101S03e16864g1_1 [Yarrowia lipolytica]
MWSLIFVVISPALAWNTNATDTLYPEEVPTKPYYQGYQLPVGSKHATPRNIEYGGYNYCSMPHPHIDTYELPAAILNGSVRGSMAGLTYIQRHQKRTSYHTYQDEDIRYDCSELVPFLFGENRDSTGLLNAAIPVHDYVYTPDSNPYVSSGYVPHGSCQFPQLTIGGLEDGFQHGRDLWNVYGDKMGIIPAVPSLDHIWLRRSNKDLTAQTAGGVLRGLWPNHNETLPIHQQRAEVDTIGSNYPCEKRDKLKKDLKKTDIWKEHDEFMVPVLDELHKTVFGESNYKYEKWSDTFQSRLCNGYPLPCANSTSCASGNAAAQVFSGEDWEFYQQYIADPNAAEYARLKVGLLVGEIIDQLKETVYNHSSVVYRHYFAHDGDLAPMATTLGLQTMKQPGMGINIAVELWKVEAVDDNESEQIPLPPITNQNEHYVRVLWAGAPIRSKLGNLEWIKFDEFVDLWSKSVPIDIVEECKVTK